MWCTWIAKKAFNRIPNWELLIELCQVGIVGNLWNLFKDYLTSREQCVMTDSLTSGIVPVTSGVPQVSILGPVLFMLYVNDIQRCVPTLETLMYADDTKLTNLLHFYTSA